MLVHNVLLHILDQAFVLLHILLWTAAVLVLAHSLLDECLVALQEAGDVLIFDGEAILQLAAVLLCQRSALQANGIVTFRTAIPTQTDDLRALGSLHARIVGIQIRIVQIHRGDGRVDIVLLLAVIAVHQDGQMTKHVGLELQHVFRLDKETFHNQATLIVCLFVHKVHGLWSRFERHCHTAVSDLGKQLRQLDQEAVVVLVPKGTLVQSHHKHGAKDVLCVAIVLLYHLEEASVVDTREAGKTVDVISNPIDVFLDGAHVRGILARNLVVDFVIVGFNTLFDFLDFLLVKGVHLQVGCWVLPCTHTRLCLTLPFRDCYPVTLQTLFRPFQ